MTSELMEGSSCVPLLIKHILLNERDTQAESCFGVHGTSISPVENVFDEFIPSTDHCQFVGEMGRQLLHQHTKDSRSVLKY